MHTVTETPEGKGTERAGKEAGNAGEKNRKRMSFYVENYRSYWSLGPLIILWAPNEIVLPRRKPMINSWIIRSSKLLRVTDIISNLLSES